MTGTPQMPPPHTDVGAYALGLLDATESARFEDHLVECTRCGQELERMLGTAALLDELSVQQVVEQPRSDLLTRLLGAVTDRRRRDRRRRLLVAAVVAVLVGAGGTGVVALAGADAAPGRVEAAHSAFQDGTQYSDTDPSTSVKAAVALDQRPWGTHVTLRLGNLKGPRTCDLVAIGRDGQRSSVASWSVPSYGYGIKGTQWKKPLYVEGALALPPSSIARFEVRDRDGEQLAVITL